MSETTMARLDHTAAPAMCCRCHLKIAAGTGYVVYVVAGARDRRNAGTDSPQDIPLQAHGECIADEVAQGILVRVSPFAFEPPPEKD